MSRVPYRLVLTFAFVAVLAAPLWAADMATTNANLPIMPVRLGEHPDFDRIVFDAPKGTQYTVKRENERVLITFSKAAKIKIPTQQIGRIKGIQVVTAAGGDNALSVSFHVAPKAELKDFFSGPSIVVDVRGSAAPSVESKEQAPKKSPEPAKQVISEPAVEAPLPKDLDKKDVVTPSPDISPSPLPPEEPKKEIKPVVESPEPVVPSSTVAPTPVPAPVPVVEKAARLPVQEPAPFHSLVPTIEADPKAVENIMKILNEATPAPVAILDPKVPVGTAVFARGGYVTILFDRKLVGDSLISSPPPRVKLEPLELPHNTGFRIAIPDGVSVRATRKDNAWEIFLVRSGVGSALSTEFVVQPEFALGARLLVATGSPPSPVFFPDPVVGDDLIVLPLRETGAFTIKRKLSDFLVVPAAQGLVIKPRHEKVVARIVPDGVEITSEGGLKLSPTQDTGRYTESGEENRKQTKVLYDFERWRGDPGQTFTQARQKLMQTIVDVSEDERVLARLDLARFYFSQGLGREALAILTVIAAKLPEIITHPDFLAVRGGSSILSGQYQSGLADLEHPSLRDESEAMLWKGIALAELRDWAGAFEKFSVAIDVLVNYPEPFRSRFLVLALETAAAYGKDQKVAAWIAKFEKYGYDSRAEPALHYLRGVLYSKAGRADMAEKLWRQVVKSDDRLYKIRAELALVDLGVATRSLTPKQAVERLEGLRFAWRGDDLELDILKRLGGFYMDAKNFRMGFNVLSQALRLFPNAGQTGVLRADMIRTFRDIFLTDLGKEMSPLDALSLFTDFKTLIPAGEDGNEVRRNLAERLIDIDLLDQASKLLEDHLKNSTKPEERVKTATRLAGVRLLDHKADSALAFLDQSQGEAAGLPQAIQNERQLLRVRALSELGKYSDALAALPRNGEKATMLLRADIAMRAKNWQDATKALLDLVGPLEAGKPLSEEKAGWLVNAAVSMAQSADMTGLDRLAIDYGDAMDKTTKANLFKVLTRPEKMTQMKDIRAAQARLSEVDMFRGVLDSYRSNEKTPATP